MNNYIKKAKEIVLNFINKDKITVFLFGSRADGTYRSDSDIDIGFLSNEKIDNSLFGKIRYALEESIAPYHFDLVDFSKTDNELKKIANKQIIIWNKSKNFK